MIAHAWGMARVTLQLLTIAMWRKLFAVTVSMQLRTSAQQVPALTELASLSQLSDGRGHVARFDRHRRVRVFISAEGVSLLAAGLRWFTRSRELGPRYDRCPRVQALVWA